MAKVRTLHRCTECGATAPKWSGRCAACGEWNTLVEEHEAPPAELRTATGSLVPGDPPVPIIEVGDEQGRPCPTGLAEVDRLLGGGLVPGSVTLVHGEPGVGKSTLLLELAASVAAQGRRVLYVTGEESKQQVRARAARLGALRASLWLAAETVLGRVVGALDDVRPDLLVVDSVQTVVDPELGGTPGTVGQVREVAYRLVQEAKLRGLAVVLVGHVTKDGGLAGPRVLEHVVDTVLAFEGDRHHALRLLRAHKHRFGSTAELALFEMTGAGLSPVPDPSSLLLADRRAGASGSVVVPALDGSRPLLVEVQALVAPSELASPRRSANGVDSSRLAMLLAVLDRRARLSTVRHDVYVSAVGGVRLAEPGADLAVALAVASAVLDVAVPATVVVSGEVGLVGEVRQASQLARRLAEAARLGFGCAIVPRSAPDVRGLEYVRVDTVGQAVDALRALAGAGGPF